MTVYPVRMFKYLFLKAYSNLSDVKLVRQAKSDFAYKYFLNLAPGDDVINPSSLTKFRRQRTAGEGKRTIGQTCVGTIVLFSVHARIKQRFFSAFLITGPFFINTT
ncbi:transposase [Exiguobacterium sp. B2(2022)]|uniref:transposase n=1 Tax=Exiguobacterium sp. B2(2022) TaxID=2992755 RepID=UPI00406CD5C4